MKNLASTVVIASLLQIVHSYHGDTKTCYDCADTPLNFMCSWGGMLADPWHAVCCSPSNPSIYCKPSEKNKCSPSFAKAKQAYFMNCPKVSSTMCGSSSKDMKMQVKKVEPTYFSHSGIKRWESFTNKAGALQANQYDACHYILETSTALYGTGKIRVEIKSQKNVVITPLAGETVEKATAANVKILDNVIFEVDVNLKLVLMVIPEKNAEDTSYKFGY